MQIPGSVLLSPRALRALAWCHISNPRMLIPCLHGNCTVTRWMMSPTKGILVQLMRLRAWGSYGTKPPGGTCAELLLNPMDCGTQHQTLETCDKVMTWPAKPPGSHSP